MTAGPESGWAFVPGRPVPFARTRGAGHRRYHDDRYASWLELACWRLRQAFREPHRGLVALEITVTPTGIGMVMKDTDVRRDTGQNRLRGDLDNYLKAVLDAANRIAYHDDAQVVHLDARFAPGFEHRPPSER